MLVGIYCPSPLQIRHSHPECLWEPDVPTQKMCNSICRERGKTTVPQCSRKGIVPVRRAGSGTFHQLYVPPVNLLPLLTAPPPPDTLTATRFTGLCIGNTKAALAAELQKAALNDAAVCARFTPCLAGKHLHPGLRAYKSSLNSLRQHFQGQGGNCFCTAWHLCPLLETPISPLRPHQPRPPRGQALSRSERCS